MLTREVRTAPRDEAAASGSAFWHPFSHMGRTRQARVVFVRGRGCVLEDRDGREHLDATASLWYCNVGHGREEIAAAMAEQAARLASCSSFDVYAADTTLALADRLAEMAPVDDPVVLLVNAGSDGIETAAKLARRYWAEVGRPEKTVVIAREGAFHGLHAYGTSLAGIAANREGFGRLVHDAEVVPAMDVDALAARIDALGAERVAAFVAEPVIGAGGVHPPLDDYLARARALCAARGVLFVADEVVTGFGRTGASFASERYGIRPDLLVLAKGLTSGYAPLGAVVASGAIAAPFWDAQPGGPSLRHGYTYSGHASGCAAAMANLDVIEREGLVARAAELESVLRSTVGALAALPGVPEVRVAGLMAGVQLDADWLAERGRTPADVVVACRERGVLTRALADGSLQVSPPLVVGEDQLERIGEVIAGSIESS